MKTIIKDRNNYEKVNNEESLYKLVNHFIIDERQLRNKKVNNNCLIKKNDFTFEGKVLFVKNGLAQIIRDDNNNYGVFIKETFSIYNKYNFVVFHDELNILNDSLNDFMLYTKHIGYEETLLTMMKSFLDSVEYSYMKNIIPESLDGYKNVDDFKEKNTQMTKIKTSKREKSNINYTQYSVSGLGYGDCVETSSNILIKGIIKVSILFANKVAATRFNWSMDDKKYIHSVALAKKVHKKIEQKLSHKGIA